MLKRLLHTLSPRNGKGSLEVNPGIHHSGKKLEFSELRYRRLFETAQDGILILDGDSGKIIDANPFLKEILGYPQEELLGKELWEIGVFKDIFDSKKAFLELKDKGYIRYKDLPLQTKDGRKIDVEFVSNVYMVGKEKVIQCNIRDISDRKKTEQAMEARTKELEDLTRSQEKTKKAMLNVMEDLEQAKSVIEIEKAKDEAILASIGDGLIAVDMKRKVLVMNKMAEEILGRKLEQLIGKEITSLPLALDAQGPILPLNKRPTFLAITANKPISNVYYYIRPNETRLPIAITATPIKLGGKIIGLVETVRDVTHEQEIDKAKSEFVSLASHQLRTPLGVIKWYLESLQNEAYFKNAPPDIQKYFVQIYKSNERVLSLVRDLLSVSRIDQGQVKNAPKLTDIVKIVTEIVGQMQVLASKKKIALRLTVRDKKIPDIFIDVLRFHEVVENLIANAIEYTTEPGAVDVTMSHTGELLKISVKDTGIGISEQEQKKLFTKFFRGEKAVIQNPEGTGLGLYVVKSYVEGWGGNISLESKEGYGSTFTISLPVSKKKKA